MSFLLRTLPRRQLLLRPISTPALRTFTTQPRLRLKEDSTRSGEENHAIKEEQRQKAEQGKGEWREEIASSSESHIAADKEHVKDHDSHIEDLQKQTAQESEAEHPHGKS